MKVNFVIAQIAVVMVKAILPFLTFNLFYELYGAKSSSYFVLMSLSAFVSNICNMSSNTLAPTYFFSNKSPSIEENFLFQLFRFTLSIFLVFISSTYIFLFSDVSFFEGFSVILYPVILSLLPTWYFYSLGRFWFVLFVEFICRMPVFFALILGYIYEDLSYIFFSYYAVLTLFLLWSFIFFRVGFAYYSLNGILRVFKYFLFVFPNNLVYCTFNSGLTFFVSFFVGSELINQLYFIERVKMLFLQSQGVLFMASLGRNIKNHEVSGFKDFFNRNRMYFFLVSASFILFVFSYFDMGFLYLEFFQGFSLDFLFYYVLYSFSFYLASINSFLVSYYFVKALSVKIVFENSMLVLFSSLLLVCAYFCFKEVWLLMLSPLWIEVFLSLFLLYRGVKLSV